MGREARVRFAMRVCHGHRELMRKVVEYVLSVKFATVGPMDVGDMEREAAVTDCLEFNVYYYVGSRRMAFTLLRERRPTSENVRYYPPAPFADGDMTCGDDEPVAVPLGDLAARVDRDTADMTVFDAAVRSERRLDVPWVSGAVLAAEKTAGFWHDAREEFVRKTWAPDRHTDWCLSHDERCDIGLA